MRRDRCRARRPGPRRPTGPARDLRPDAPAGGAGARPPRPRAGLHRRGRGNAASLRALLSAGFVPIGGEALFLDRAAEPAPAAALVLTGSPGAGKSSVLEALTTLLGDAGIAFGAIESEQLAWGRPWLPEELCWAQLATVCRMQRGYGRRLFLVVATTETDADLRAVVAATGAERTLVVCLHAPPAVVAERVLAREPERWSGRDALAARRLADTIPGLARVDIVRSTDGETDDDVACRVRDELAARGLLDGG